MQITFDGYPVQDAVQEQENLVRHGFPVPPDFGRANCFVNVLGPQPARGWFLLSRSTLNAITIDGLHTVVLTDDDSNSITLNNLVIAEEPIGLTTGTIGDVNNVFLVEVADRRHQLASPFLGVACFKQYNVRAPAWGGAYYAGSLSGGTVTWTWLTMVQDLWGLMPQLGTAPAALPFTPNGTPEGWQFPGVSAYHALNQVLYRIGCALVYNPTVTSNQYSLVRVGSGDTATDAKLATLEASTNRFLFSEEPLTVNLGLVPGKVRVYFHTQYLHYGTEQTTPQSSTQWLTNAVQSVDVAAGTVSSATGISSADATLIHPIWDDLPALANPDGTISNSSALTTRATERAADFYRMLTGAGGVRLRKIYRGILPSVQPSGGYRGVAWRQDLTGLGDPDGGGGGLVTEVVRFPWWITEVEVPKAGPLMDDSGFSISNRPPWFGPTPPNYPHLLQVVRLDGTTTVFGGNTYYGGYVQQFNPATGAWGDQEQIWVRDANV